MSQDQSILTFGKLKERISSYHTAYGIATNDNVNERLYEESKKIKEYHNKLERKKNLDLDRSLALLKAILSICQAERC